MADDSEVFGAADRLLPGEEADPERPSLQQISHWIAVYSELLNAKGATVEDHRQSIAHGSKAARDELERGVFRLLEQRAAQFQLRLAYWESKATEFERGSRTG